jgi:hypothetical protein
MHKFTRGPVTAEMKIVVERYLFTSSDNCVSMIGSDFDRSSSVDSEFADEASAFCSLDMGTSIESIATRRAINCNLESVHLHHY